MKYLIDVVVNLSIMALAAAWPLFAVILAVLYLIANTGIIIIFLLTARMDMWKEFQEEFSAAIGSINYASSLAWGIFMAVMGFYTEGTAQWLLLSSAALMLGSMVYIMVIAYTSSASVEAE
jgi:peptidoglycan/LPS O-acetylase OafA/YrhL